MMNKNLEQKKTKNDIQKTQKPKMTYKKHKNQK